MIQSLIYKSQASICLWKSWRISDGYLENPHCLASAARKRQSSSPSERGVASTVSILLSIYGNTNGQKKATVLAGSQLRNKQHFAERKSGYRIVRPHFHPQLDLTNDTSCRMAFLCFAFPFFALFLCPQHRLSPSTMGLGLFPLGPCRNFQVFRCHRQIAEVRGASLQRKTIVDTCRDLQDA